MRAQTVEVMSRFLEIVARTAYDTKKPGSAYCDVKVDNEDVAEEIINAIEDDEGGVQALLDILEIGKSLKRYARINLLDEIGENDAPSDWGYDDDLSEED